MTKGYRVYEIQMTVSGGRVTLSELFEGLASFDAASESRGAEAGNYVVKAGASSTSFQLTAAFSLKDRLVTEKVNRILSPQIAIHELKP